MRKRLRFAVVLALAVILAGGAVYFFEAQQGPSCSQPLGGARVLKSQLSSINFGAVTKFKLPSPDRNPNGVVVAQDGSVWFGEQTLPGVGHVFPNGTLIEYVWPFSYPTQSGSGQGCVPKTEMWGITLWNGNVWAADPTGNQLVGLTPATQTFQSIKLPRNSSFPYSLTVDPQDSLWFTELFGSMIGRVDQNGTLHEYHLPGGNQSVPSEIVFVNKTLGYYSDAGEAGVGNGGVYSFNPNNFSPHAVTGSRKLNLPTSLALADGGIWLALHGSSEIAFFNFTRGTWTSYATSTVTYVDTTLPYFIKSNGSTVWFNEHYGNRVAMVNPQKNQLTEYSLSKPPATSGSDIDNALTFALGNGKAWFTEWTANYVGFVDMSYRPTFSVSVDNRTLSLAPGNSKDVTVMVSGQSPSPLALKFSDSESFTGTPKAIKISSDQQTILSLSGQERITIHIQAGTQLPVGVYTVAITASDGLVSRSSYVELSVA